MSKRNAEDRVLGRTNARVMTEQELNYVYGGLKTGLCSINPRTCRTDGDCEPPPAC